MIIVMDKNEVVRQGVGVILNAFVMSPVSAKEAVEAVLQISAIDYAVVNPDHYAGAVGELSPHVPVVVLTANRSASAVLKAKRDGASGYVHVSQSAGNLRKAVQDAIGGSPLDVKRVLEVVLDDAEANAPLCKLSERQLEVLHGLCEGWTAQTIADAIGIKVGTVRGYIQDVYVKIGVRNRVQAVLWAVKKGMI